MSQEDSGDKTELPTPKRIKDARKDGNVAKSKELTSTLVVLAWVLMLAMLGNHVLQRFTSLFDTAAAAVGFSSSPRALPARYPDSSHTLHSFR